jgi:hypothetical protein
MVAGPVSSGMVSGTTAMLAPMAALAAPSSSSWLVGLASAGWALSMFSELISSSMPPPTWKLASEMLKNSRIFRPSRALVAITTNALNDAVQMVLHALLAARSPGCSG